MIRPATTNDTEAILELATTALGFEAGEREALSLSISQSFASNSLPFWLTDEQNENLVGAAYCEPERMTHGTWNILFIAIHPAHQGKGRGTALMQSVEQQLAKQGDRLLLVETLASLKETRAFYLKNGYEEEACIRDYYDAGQDKIIYRKALQ